MRIFAVKRRKASLSLSLNAIVILILAIAMLGLGLAFIRGIFKSITAKVDQAVDAGEIVNPPTRDNPLTLTPPSVELRQGQTYQVKLAFINSLPEEVKCQIDPKSKSVYLIYDRTGMGTMVEPKILFSDGCYLMKKDQINIWTISISTETGTKPTFPTTYIDSIKMVCYTSTANCGTGIIKGEFTKDLTITVET